MLNEKILRLRELMLLRWQAERSRQDQRRVIRIVGKSWVGPYSFPIAARRALTPSSS